MRALVIFAISILRSALALPGPGRPPISKEIQELIVRMATETCWRARKIQAALRLVRDRPRETASSSLRRHRESDFALGDPAALRDLSQRAKPSIPDPRQRFDRLARSHRCDQELRDRPEAHSVSKPMAERTCGALRRQCSA